MEEEEEYVEFSGREKSQTRSFSAQAVDAGIPDIHIAKKSLMPYVTTQLQEMKKTVKHLEVECQNSKRLINGLEQTITVNKKENQEALRLKDEELQHCMYEITNLIIAIHLTHILVVQIES